MLPPSAVDIIERVRLGFVATVTPGGRPAVSPKGTFVVLDAARIAFADIRSPGTLTNLSHRPEVEVNFVDTFTRKGCRVAGATDVIRPGSDAFDALLPHWVTLWPSLADRIQRLVVITVSAVKPLSTPPYDDGVTEAEMVALYKQKYAEMYP